MPTTHALLLLRFEDPATGAKSPILGPFQEVVVDRGLLQVVRPTKADNPKRETVASYGSGGHYPRWRWTCEDTPIFDVDEGDSPARVDWPEFHLWTLGGFTDAPYS